MPSQDSLRIFISLERLTQSCTSDDITTDITCPLSLANAIAECEAVKQKIGHVGGSAVL